MANIKKRDLKFNDLDEMLDDAQSLLDNGYDRHGNWTLGQIASHVADWSRYAIDGFPVPPLPIRMLLWIMKHTVGPGMKRKILAEGFSGGMQTSPESVADPAQMSDAEGVQKLRETMQRLRAHQGELLPSPLFGPMDHAMLVRVTILHAEHHFGYLDPKSKS